LDVGREERWVRTTDEPEVLDVSAFTITEGVRAYWVVGVSTLELVRGEPLEKDLRLKIATVLHAVDGIDAVWEEDRTVWGVTGAPSGQTLVRAVAEILDVLAPSIRADIAW
jgi:hypothetical protein